MRKTENIRIFDVVDFGRFNGPPKPKTFLLVCDCMVLCVRMCVCVCHFSRMHVISVCVSIIREPDSGSSSVLQYLVPPKPTMVPACLRESVCFCVYHSWSRVHIISGSCCAGVCVSCIQSSGSALQYLVPPKPTIVPAGIQPSHSSLWSLTWCHANLFSWRSEPNVTKCICRNIDLWCWVFEQTGRKSI